MTDFRFNFQLDGCDAAEDPSDVKIDNVLATEHTTSSFSLKEALQKWKCEKECEVKVVPVGDKDFYVLPTRHDEIDQHSDRIAGVYEGGLKIWECSVDLAKFIRDGNIDLSEKSVCELGCGVGLPGIAAAQSDCANVVFQDFNEFVLTNCTAPSVCCNHAMHQKKSRGSRTLSREEIEEASGELENLQFVSGDWSKCSFSNKADVILTAETIYDVSYYSKLHDLLDRTLNKNGVVYVASKAFYFGVGGGTHEWSRYCESLGVFNVGISLCVDAPLKRYILKMTRKT